MKSKRNNKIWSYYYKKLVDYIQLHNTQYISTKDTENLMLLYWCAKQRTKQRKGTLTPEEAELLKALNFEFEPYDAKWDSWYIKLQKYKEETGDANITYKNKVDVNLSIWLYNQKRKYKAGKLTLEQIKKLAALNIKWPVI